MLFSGPLSLSTLRHLKIIERLMVWWHRQSPIRQDRYAMLAPLIAVFLFLAAIVAAFGYLRLEEMEREQEAVRHDIEYTQQRLRLRLVERQEQLVRMAQEIASHEIGIDQFNGQAQGLTAQNPELQVLSWIDERKRVKASAANPVQTSTQATVLNKNVAASLASSESASAFALAKELLQPIYVQRSALVDNHALLQLHVPVIARGNFAGVLLAEFSVENLYRYGVPPEISARYAVSLIDAKGLVLAGISIPKRNPASQLLPWARQAIEYEVPVSPVGNGLLIRAQAYRTSLGVIGSGLFWLVCALSVLTAWMLIGNWRHTRKRLQAQQALLSETNFRRAMEDSMPTGMRTLDMAGHITYVNPAFCQMTGWSEAELVGQTAPFPYWPEEDHTTLMGRLKDELNDRITRGGFQIRVKRKDDTRFDARIYVSPLIDSHGIQKGWMTSITDITEPNRIREQLSASYERFTTVLEALDASVSVAPIGTDELLFANKKYRLWFNDQSNTLVSQAAKLGLPPTLPNDAGLDTVDALAGMPSEAISDSETESTEVFVPELDKWLEVRTRYLTWVDGRLAQMVIATDITQRRLAQEQAAAQAERAQTASRLITMGEMASSVAHELNQPLTAISNYCNGMVSRIKAQQISEEDLLGALEKTGKQAQRAGLIIQRIRAFVKRSEPNRTLSDIASMVEEAVELASIELRRSNVRLTHHVDATLPPLLVDPILIEQVLINLLKNGAESIVQANRPPEDRRVGLLVVPMLVEGKPVVEFSIWDTGKGISPEVMKRLYESFYTTKAEGLGIGLSLCRSIVESHQGRMKTENLYNGNDISGCCFTFWIPQIDVINDSAHPTRQTNTVSG
jgi:PAS domain S-box-containing protein